MELSYLFAAYTVVWLGVLLYVGALARRSRGLERELAELRHLLAERSGERKPGEIDGG
jgi:CcmD family protein